MEALLSRMEIESICCGAGSSFATSCRSPSSRLRSSDCATLLKGRAFLLPSRPPGSGAAWCLDAAPRDGPPTPRGPPRGDASPAPPSLRSETTTRGPPGSPPPTALAAPGAAPAPVPATGGPPAAPPGDIHAARGSLLGPPPTTPHARLVTPTPASPIGNWVRLGPSRRSTASRHAPTPATSPRARREPLSPAVCPRHALPAPARPLPTLRPPGWRGAGTPTPCCGPCWCPCWALPTPERCCCWQLRSGFHRARQPSAGCPGAVRGGAAGGGKGACWKPGDSTSRDP